MNGNEGTSPVRASSKERFAAYLSGNGQRFTQYMAWVVDEALARHGTFEEEDIAASLAGKVSRASLFRTLSKLLTAGLLHRALFNGRIVYVAASSNDVGL